MSSCSHSRFSQGSWHARRQARADFPTPSRLERRRSYLSFARSSTLAPVTHFPSSRYRRELLLQSLRPQAKKGVREAVGCHTRRPTRRHEAVPILVLAANPLPHGSGGASRSQRERSHQYGQKPPRQPAVEAGSDSHGPPEIRSTCSSAKVPTAQRLARLDDATSRKCRAPKVRQSLKVRRSRAIGDLRFTELRA